MEYRQSYYSSDEFEIIEMLGIYARVWVYLKRVVVVCGVFEQTVEGIEHFVR